MSVSVLLCVLGSYNIALFHSTGSLVKSCSEQIPFSSSKTDYSSSEDDTDKNIHGAQCMSDTTDRSDHFKHGKTDMWIVLSELHPLCSTFASIGMLRSTIIVLRV